MTPENTQPTNEHSSAGAAPGTGSASPQKPHEPFYRRMPFWIVLGMLLGILLMLLLTRCQPVRHTTQPQDIVAPQELLELQKMYTMSLEEELRRLEDALRQDPCALPEFLAPSPDKAPLAPGALPEGQKDAPRATPETSQSNGTAAAPENPAPIDTTPTPPPATVAQLMEQATVFILAATDEGIGSGTGFFVAPGIIATNRHVAMSPGAAIFAGNKLLGGMHKAQVVAFSNDPNRDYALIALPGAKGKTPVLHIADTGERTERISSWGFPGLITEADPKYEALLAGDPSAVPEVVYSEGVVSAVLDRKPPFIMHTAQISQGNSGGPLIDAKGTVLGINTFIRKAEQSNAQANIALPGSDLKRFMQEHGVAPSAPGK